MLPWRLSSSKATLSSSSERSSAPAVRPFRLLVEDRSSPGIGQHPLIARLRRAGAPPVLPASPLTFGSDEERYEEVGRAHTARLVGVAYDQPTHGHSG